MFRGDKKECLSWKRRSNEIFSFKNVVNQHLFAAVMLKQKYLKIPVLFRLSYYKFLYHKYNPA